MSQSAFIKLVDGSEAASLTLDEVKELFITYQEQTAKTGEQLGWEYAAAAFPYTIETKPEGEGKWFYLKGTSELYRHIVVGVGSEQIEADTSEAKAEPKAESKAESDDNAEPTAEDKAEDAANEANEANEESEEQAEQVEQAPVEQPRRHFIQLVLPDGSTHGDKSKGNEFAKHFAKKLKAELQLFNGRTMYYNPRK